MVAGILYIYLFPSLSLSLSVCVCLFVCSESAYPQGPCPAGYEEHCKGYVRLREGPGARSQQCCESCTHTPCGVATDTGVCVCVLCWGSVAVLCIYTMWDGGWNAGECRCCCQPVSPAARPPTACLPPASSRTTFVTGSPEACTHSPHITAAASSHRLSCGMYPFTAAASSHRLS